MKKNQIETIKKDIENILNNYNYNILENNLYLLNNELLKIENKIKTLQDERNEKKEVFKTNNNLYSFVNNPDWKKYREENEQKQEKEKEKKEILLNTIESYESIIKNVLNEILLKVLQLYFKNIVTSRDHNDFIKIFEYDSINKKYPYLIRFSYSGGYQNRFYIISNKYNIENYFYIKFYINMDNKVIFEENEKKENILNYNFIDFKEFSIKYNIFDLMQIKKDIKKIIDISNKEYQKIKNQIEESTKKINDINIYNIRYFKNLLN